jgi:hypothetical protein
LEKEGALARPPFSVTATTPVLSARFFVFISSVTFLRPGKKETKIDELRYPLLRTFFLEGEEKDYL